VFTLRVLQKGKITIPVEIREALGIKEGEALTLEMRGGSIILLPPNTVPNPTEVLDGLVEGVSLGEPVEFELRRASAARVEGKLLRAGN
jgi:AbrB family looped-hinge helix DNA binding protein